MSARHRRKHIAAQWRDVRRLNILAIPHSFDAIGYYRIVNPYLELAKRHNVTIHDGFRLLNLAAFDVVAMSYPPRSEMLFGAIVAAQARGTKFVLDFDDDHQAEPESSTLPKLPSENHAWIELLIGVADAITTTCGTLVDKYARYARGEKERFFVCRNSLDATFWDASLAGRVRTREDGKVRIGWMGGITHVDDVRMIVPAVVKILNEYPHAEFHIAGDRGFLDIFPQTVASQIIYDGHTYDRDAANKQLYRAVYPLDDMPAQRLPKLLERMDLDIAIAPSIKRAFSESKSWLKIIEYGAAGAAVVASNIGPYAEYDQVYPNTIVIPDGIEDWHRALKRLVDDPQERTRLADRNRECVRSSHMTSSRIHEWEAALQYAFTASANVAASNA